MHFLSVLEPVRIRLSACLSFLKTTNGFVRIRFCSARQRPAGLRRSWAGLRASADSRSRLLARSRVPAIATHSSRSPTTPGSPCARRSTGTDASSCWRRTRTEAHHLRRTAFPPVDSTPLFGRWFDDARLALAVGPLRERREWY